jgi:hypothetical protein
MGVQVIIHSIPGYFISMKNANKQNNLLLKAPLKHSLSVRIKP